MRKLLDILKYGELFLGYARIEARLAGVAKNSAFRIAFALLIPVLSFGGLDYLYIYGVKTLPQCAFRFLTGLYCPGCGSGRALYHILHLDLIGALGFNPLFCLMLPVILYYGVKTYLDIVMAKKVWPDIPLDLTTLKVTLGVMLFYTVLRNVPLAPFNLWAPP